MITVYHNLDPGAMARLTDPAERERYCPSPQDLELAAVVESDDLTAAFDQVIHRDGEDWPSGGGLTVFGEPRGRRTTVDGDVFVTGDGTAHLVLPVGFRPLPGLRLPYRP